MTRKKAKELGRKVRKQPTIDFSNLMSPQSEESS